MSQPTHLRTYGHCQASPTLFLCDFPSQVLFQYECCHARERRCLEDARGLFGVLHAFLHVRGQMALTDIDGVRHPIRVGMCVTGQARGFLVPGARASLRSLIDALPGPQPVVRISIARMAGCASAPSACSIPLSKACYDEQKCAFEPLWSCVTLQSLQADFPRANIDLHEHSSCAQPAVASTACCRLSAEARRDPDAKQPISFLQYWHMTTCIDRLLDEHRSLNRVIRARPDLVYLDIGPIVAAVRHASDHPILLQRGDTIDRHNKNRSSMMIDWFMVAPAGGNESRVTHARRFFRGSLLGYIEQNCEKGRSAQAFNHAPEIEWMRWPHSHLPWSVRKLPISMRMASSCSCGQFASPYAEECAAACEEAAPVPVNRTCSVGLGEA